METILETIDAGPVVLAGSEKIEPIDPVLLNRHAPTVHVNLFRANQLAARCSIWTESTPAYRGERLGVLGHYAAADVHCGAAVIARACDALNQRGFRQVVGPMDGNTWRRYRLLTQRGTEPPFFLEPDNPDDWPAHFAFAGFSPLARYFSSLNSDLAASDPRVAPAMTRLEAQGVYFRNINLSRLEEELKAIHELSLESFAGNFLYTPIRQSEFLAMHAALGPHLRPELVLLAEKDARLIGFIFGLPDLAQAQRGERVTTAIAKSMAVHPSQSGIGLGGILMDQFHHAARTLGYSRVIHALMHESNRSLKISSHTGQLIRQYTLYWKKLG